jgi:hypothetical protein
MDPSSSAYGGSETLSDPLPPSIKPKSLPIIRQETSIEICCCCQGAPGEQGDTGEDGKNILNKIFILFKR